MIEIDNSVFLLFVVDGDDEKKSRSQHSSTYLYTQHTSVLRYVECRVSSSVGN